MPGVLGIHIEGPFINVTRKGIHDADEIPRARRRTDRAAQLAAPAARVLLTLAPEMVDPAIIRALAAAGVIVAPGHSEATYDHDRAAIAAGMTGFTHLFNAMSPLSHRAPGVVGAALDDRDTIAG